MARKREGWQRVAVGVGASMIAGSIGWWVTWGSIVLSTDPPQHRTFWIGVTWVTIAAFVLGVILLALGELRVKPDARELPGPVVPRSIDLSEPFSGQQLIEQAKMKELRDIAAAIGQDQVERLLFAGMALHERMGESSTQWRRSGTFQRFSDQVDAWIADCERTGGPEARSIVRRRRPLTLADPRIKVTVIKHGIEDADQLVKRMEPWMTVLQELTRLPPDYG